MSELSFYCDLLQEKLVLPLVFDKNRDKKFFIFGDSYASVDKYYPESWAVEVCNFFNAAQYTWAIPGASEQTIFNTFIRTLKQDRDFTIIFHTHPHRKDSFFGLHDLPMDRKFFEKWDSLITFPCLHIYWSTYNYSFKNGRTLHCSYPEAGSNKYQIHHMSNEDNSLLAKDIISIIEASQ